MRTVIWVLLLFALISASNGQQPDIDTDDDGPKQSLMFLVDTNLAASRFSSNFQESGAVLTSERLFPNISRAVWQFRVSAPRVSKLKDGLDSAVGASIIAASSRASDETKHAYVTSEWNLDRIDQADNNLNGQYNPGSAYTGQGTHVYIVDTGVVTNHPELVGRVSLDFTAYGSQFTDDVGHGSHVAGIVASTTYGVAKLAHIHSYKALSSTGGGTLGSLAAALAHLLANLQKPAVINLSLTYKGFDPVIDALLTSLINAGAVIVAAGGNDNTDACSTWPCVTNGVLCVGSTTILDQRSSFSNYGSCIDIWAPGSSIVSLDKDGSGTATLSGTSMASPHCAGDACLYLTVNPTALSSTVSQAIINRGTRNRLLATSLGRGSPNILLYAVWDSVPSISTSVTTTTTVAVSITTRSSSTSTTSVSVSSTLNTNFFVSLTLLVVCLCLLLL